MGGGSLFYYSQWLVIKNSSLRRFIRVLNRWFILGFPRDGTSRCPFCPRTKIFPCPFVPLSLCPRTRGGAKIPGQNRQSRDVPGQNHFPPKKQKTGKVRFKTGKGCSKTGKEVLKQEKDALKQEKMFWNKKTYSDSPVPSLCHPRFWQKSSDCPASCPGFW